MKTFEYGAVSSKYSCQAENKLTAYCAMVIHYNCSAHLIALYTEECKQDSWLCFDGKISARLDEIFGGPNAFDKYLEENKKLVRACHATIKQLV
jgi:hypothetical protein